MYGVDIQGTLSPTEIEAKEKYMVTLCERLGLSDLISKLPKGYDTVIGD
jgi:ABC-type multidrug transport system fused ATPase/permease subunit